MRYIDSGSRDTNQALGSWLVHVLTEIPAELRIQSGFFVAEALGILAPTLLNLASENAMVTILIGSNRPGTDHNAVRRLAELLGLPRPNARLGLVSYSNAFFHPKVYHVKRSDGSQCAYVGSANLTPQGLTALHIEAGIVLDTRDGDPEDIFNNIASAIDEWFVIEKQGLYAVHDVTTIDALLAQGILSAAPPPMLSSTSYGANQGGATRSSLHPLIALPPLPESFTVELPVPPVPAPPTMHHPSIVVNGFPGYMLFVPDPDSPTSGTEALSGATLPGGAVGLIIRLNNDSARHFLQRPGTANISVPVATLSTLRFGVYGSGTYPNRPRAEYNLLLRYISQSMTIYHPTPVPTSVMAYGFLREETGHKDIRMVLPAAVKQLSTAIQARGLPIPQPSDLALMEWPTPTSPEFRFTFAQRRSDLYQMIENFFTNAVLSHQLVGEGACWLPPGFSPDWS